MIKTISLALFCAAAARAEINPDDISLPVLVAAEVALMLDVSQTLDIKNHPGMQESNPFLGKHPSDRKILIVGGLIPMGLTAGVWAVSPKNFKIIMPLIVLSIEISTLIYNAQGGLVFRIPI